MPLPFSLRTPSRPTRRPLTGLVALLVVAAAPSAQDAGSWSDVFAYPGARLELANYGPSQPPATVFAVEADRQGGYYVGGRFTSIDGVPRSYVAHWDGREWSSLGGGLRSLSPYQEVTVRDLLLARDGSLYATGQFDSAIQRNGRAVSANGIVRWTGTEWQPLGGGLYANPNSPPYGRGLAEAPDGSIYVVGAFEAAIGTDGIAIPVYNGARWMDGRWEAIDTGRSNASLEEIAVGDDGAIALSGAFIDSESYYRVGVVVIQPDGSSDLILEAYPVDALAWSDGDLYVGGTFAGVPSAAARNVARWDGQTWDTLEGGIDGRVFGLVPTDDGSVYAVGAFAIAGVDAATPVTANGIARWTGTEWMASGGILTSALYYEPTWIQDVAVWGSDVVVGGTFEGVRSADGSSRSATAIAVRRGDDWAPLSSYEGRASVGRRPSALNGSSSVLASAPSPCGRGVLVGGGLPSVGALPTAGVGLWDGQTWHAFPGEFSPYPEVRAIAPSGCDGGRPQFFVAGVFTSVLLENGTSVDLQGIAFWDGQTWRAPEGVAPDGFAQALAYDSNAQVLYAAGSLSQPQQGNGYSSYGVYRWTSSAGWSAVGGGVDGPIVALALDDAGRLYVGGSFSNVRQTSGLVIGASGLARWNSDVWEWIGNPTSASIGALAFGPDGRLYAGGTFNTFAQPSKPDVVARNVAVWDGSAWSDYGPLADGVWALAVGAGGRVYAGYAGYSYWYTANEQRLFVNEPDGWRPLGIRDGSVATLTLDGDDLYVGGTFTSAGPTPSAFLALYTDPKATPLAAAPSSRTLALEVAPNPVSTHARIALEVAEAGQVRAAVYDALGREVAVLWDGPASAGSLTLDLEPTRLPVGTYVARVQSGAASATRVFTVVR